MALENPRFEDSPVLFISGIQRAYPTGTLHRAVEQWGVLPAVLPQIVGRVGANTYGLWFDLFKKDQPSQLVTGAQVGQFAPISNALNLYEIPALRYAIFTHRGHVSDLSKTLEEVFEKWLPRSGKKHFQAQGGSPDYMEVYPPGFVAETGLGPIELWVPINK